MKTEGENQKEDKSYFEFINRQKKTEEIRKAKAEMWVIEQQIKASAKFAEENGGA